MGTAAALSVRCLGCGQVYLKPIDGAVAASAHDCPTCGYVGWIPAAQAVSSESESEPLRFASDPPPHQPWRGR